MVDINISVNVTDYLYYPSEAGAETYAIIRSCINTYKKQKINVYSVFIKAFNREIVIA